MKLTFSNFGYLDAQFGHLQRSAENTKPGNHLPGLILVAGDDAAILGTWIEELFRLIVCVD